MEIDHYFLFFVKNVKLVASSFLDILFCLFIIYGSEWRVLGFLSNAWSKDAIWRRNLKTSLRALIKRYEQIEYYIILYS